MLLLQQMIVLFIYMMLGYYGSKSGALDARAGKALSWIVVNIANPGLIINSAISGEARVTGTELAATVLTAVILLGCQLILAQLVPFLFRTTEEETGIYKFMTAFNNIGYMGFPVISAVYGSEALLRAAVFTIPFNVLLYTVGVSMIRGKDRDETGSRWGKIFNVGVAACLIATVLYLTAVPVPDFVKTAFGGLSGLTAPLSMMVIGISLSAIPLKELVMDEKLLIYSLFKQLVIPIAGTLIVRQFVENDLLTAVCMIMLATPAASMAVMLAGQYDRNTELASRGVAITTVLSVVTIPIVSAVAL